MVLVLKKKPAYKKVVCTKGCGSTLGYVENDIKTYRGKDYSGGDDGCNYINCPVCSERVVLKSW
jgi:hypothetical protein